MNETRIELSAEARRLLRDLAAAPAELPVRIARVMDYQNVLTVSHIQEAYLSFSKDGPPVEIGLRVQSNRLRGAAWAAAAMVTGAATVTSSIGDSVKYAAVHEFGLTVHHPARKGSVRLHTDAQGALIGQAKNAKLAVFAKASHADSRVRKVEFQGKAYDVTYPERKPFRRGIEDRIPEYGKAISAGVVATLSGK